MKKTNKIKLGMFFLMVILLMFSVLAYTSSNPNYGLFNSYVRDSSSFNTQCEAGQDFILQIAPFGCTPAVVRSDLLEEQNVPVFCQIAATKINPLIDVNAIESISFSGQYPREVSGIGFHPAQAALGVSGNLNSPILNNVGYVVVVLKKQPNEKNMSDYVQGNLTARITYDIQNAFGIGKASFYLPQITDEGFNQNKNQYSFWNGRGYLRVDNVDENRATIFMINDVGKITTVNLKKGQSSNNIYIPGFDCLASMKLRLDDLEAPDTTAKLDVNGEAVEVVKGEYFLDNHCRVTDINPEGIVQTIQVYCTTDEGGKKFNLRISPRVKLNIEDVSKTDFEVGDYLYQKDNGKFVYLGYIGTDMDSGKETDLYVHLVELPEKKDKLTSSEISTAAILANQLAYKRITGSTAGDIFLNVAKGILGASNALYQGIVKGRFFPILGYQIKQKIGGKDVKLIGFADAQDKWFDEFKISNQVSFDAFLCKIGSTVNVSDSSVSYLVSKTGITEWEMSTEEGGRLVDGEINDYYKQGKISDYDPSCVFEKVVGTKTSEPKTNYDNAVKDYDFVLNNYFNEKCGDITCGEEALAGKISLSCDNNQKLTAKGLCDDFKSAYPKSKKILSSCCNEKWRLANQEMSTNDVVISNVVKRISFNGIYEPTEDEYGATIKVTGPNKKVKVFTLRHNQLINLVDFRDKDENEYIQLTGLDEGKASIRYNLDTKGINTLTSAFSTDTGRLSLKVPASFGSGYTFELMKVKLKKVAKVSLIPNINNAGGTANFSFKIGIEKRAIQLSPSKTKERIANINKSIAEWQDKSNKLGKVVKGLKGACLATGAYLTVKNFIANTGGKSIARQNVMKGPGGWNEKCAALVAAKKYSTINECFFDKSDDIDRDVDDYYNALTVQNQNLKAIDSQCPQTDSSLANLFGNSVNTECAKNAYITEQYKEKLKENCQEEIDVGESKKVSCSEIVDMIDKDSISLEQARSLELNSQINSDMTKKQLQNDLKEIYVNNHNHAEAKSFQENAIGVKEAYVDSYGSKNSIQGIYHGAKASSDNWELDEGTPVQMITYDNNNYYLELEKSRTDTYSIKNVYDSDWTLLSEDQSSQQGIYDSNVAKIKSTLGKGFKKYDASAYENPFKSVSGDTGVVARFYETDPYKGMPALVPFDLKKGWYAATKQTLPIGGGISSYDASGRVMSLWVCNVGENQIAEFNSGIGDDKCEQVNLGTGAPYNNFPGLDKSQSAKIVQCAVDAIQDASRHKSGGDVSVSTSCGGSISVKVGSPAVDIPEMQCTDYMSPDECKLLFNVCDPVICPSSRCNLAGAYPVRDVIQSGIIGSIALCLPNIREGIYIPVCLTGIKAGIDSFLSVMKAHRDCLQESLDSGKMVGVCDEIYSINLCEFFWRQGLPFAKLIIPKLIEVALGQNVHGGGEYLGVANAWKHADQSISYFTQYYAANAYEAFKARTAEDVGSAVCKSYVSSVYPSGGNLLDQLTEPDSPSQFTGRFDEIPFTTATVPAISQYKVYYHIYAGKDRGAYYQVYLTEGDTSSYYQDTSYRRIVDSGYIAKGEYADQTKDFTAPSGYKKMCIRVNDQEECGFKQVSTSFGINYVNDQYMVQQAKQTNIKSEAECISGTSSAYSLISPNLQEGANELINPSIYNRGIIRICATDNPGKGTDESRWSLVGYCDNQNIKCWIDTDSVKNVIKNLDTKNQTLSSLTNNSFAALEASGDYESIDTIQGKIKDKEGLVSQSKYSEVIKLVNEVLPRTFLNYQKAILILNRAKAYSKLIKLTWPAPSTSSKTNLVVDCSGTCNGWSSSTTQMTLDECTLRSGTYHSSDGCCCYGTDNGATVDTSKNEKVVCEKVCEGWELVSTTMNSAECSGSDGKYNSNCCCYGEYTGTSQNTQTSQTPVKVEDRSDKKYTFSSFRTQFEVSVIMNAAKTTPYGDKKCLCGGDCSSIAGMIVGISKTYNIPDPLLLLSIMMQESQCNINAKTDSSVGLMQISSYEDCSSLGVNKLGDLEGRNNIVNNIKCGALILKKKYDEYKNGKTFFNKDSSKNIGSCSRDYDTVYYNWEAALRGYVGWGCNEEHDDYVEEVMNRFEELSDADTSATGVVSGSTP